MKNILKRKTLALIALSILHIASVKPKSLSEMWDSCPSYTYGSSCAMELSGTDPFKSFEENPKKHIQELKANLALLGCCKDTKCSTCTLKPSDNDTVITCKTCGGGVPQTKPFRLKSKEYALGISLKNGQLIYKEPQGLIKCN